MVSTLYKPSKIAFEPLEETKKILPIGQKIDQFEVKMAEFTEKIHQTEQLQQVAREVEFLNKTKLTSFLKRGAKFEVKI